MNASVSTHALNQVSTLVVILNLASASSSSSPPPTTTSTTTNNSNNENVLFANAAYRNAVDGAPRFNDEAASAVAKATTNRSELRTTALILNARDAPVLPVLLALSFVDATAVFALTDLSETRRAQHHQLQLDALVSEQRVPHKSRRVKGDKSSSDAHHHHKDRSPSAAAVAALAAIAAAATPAVQSHHHSSSSSASSTSPPVSLPSNATSSPPTVAPAGAASSSSSSSSTAKSLFRIRKSSFSSKLGHAFRRNNSSISADDLVPFFESMAPNEFDRFAKLTTNADAAALNRQDAQGYTLLHAAVTQADDRFALHLLALPGIRFDIANEGGNLPIHYFAGHWSSPTTVTRAFELFERGGANFSAQNDALESPLHKAVFNAQCRLLVVQLLLSRAHCSPNVQNISGDTPLMYASRLRRLDLVELLTSHGADIAIKNALGNNAFDLADADETRALLVSKIEKPSAALSPTQSRARARPQPSDHATKVVPRLSHHSLKLPRAPPSLAASGRIARLPSHPPPSSSTASNAGGAAAAAAAGGAASAAAAAAAAGPSMGRRPSVPVLSMPSSPSSAASSQLPSPRGKIVSFPSEPQMTLSRADISEFLTNSNDALWIDFAELEFLDQIGEGATATVFRAEYNGDECAVKVLRTHCNDTDVTDFKREFAMLCELKSDRFVRFLGATLEPQICLVMELCTGGPIYHVLRNETLDLHWSTVLRWLHDVADGIAVLHGLDPPIVHRDIKSHNVLLSSDGSIKLADFGLSRRTAGDAATLRKIRGTMAFLGPEVFEGGDFTTMGDMYSYGILAWEVANRACTGQSYAHPFAMYDYIKRDFQIIMHVAKKHLRPPMPDNMPEPIASVITRCWNGTPAERPAADVIAREIREIYNNKPTLLAEWDLTRRNVGSASEIATPFGLLAPVADDDDDDDDDIDVNGADDDSEIEIIKPK
jgi:serine/threonine protein kinase